MQYLFSSDIKEVMKSRRLHDDVGNVVHDPKQHRRTSNAERRVRWSPAAYAKTAATTATARPPREMTLPAAAAVDCSAGLLWVGEEDGRLVPVVTPVEPAVGATPEVALTP